MPIGTIKNLFPFSLWKNLRNSSLDSADYITTECQLFQSKIPAKISRDKISTLYLSYGNNFELSNYKISDFNKEISICYLGSMNNIIDINIIYNIISSISLSFKVKFHLIGDGEKKQELVSRVNLDNVEIIDHGKVYNEIEKSRILSQCHFGLNIMKNQTFLIDVFNEIVKIEEESKLILIGRGELESELKKKVEMLIDELKKTKGIQTKVCVTGQHREMLEQVLNVFNVVPDYNLEIMKDNQTLNTITSEILLKIRKVFEIENPDLILVHGDTTTTFATAVAAFYQGIKIGHVEAGLRTNNLQSPFPEEFNRQVVSLIADFNFAPTRASQENLIKEGKKTETIFVTGNTAIDALKTTVDEQYSHRLMEWVGDDRLIMITAHRRENLGEPMENMFKAIKRVLDEHNDVKAIYPIHKNPRVREVADRIFSKDDRIKIIEPLEVIDFHNLLNKSYLILTDSGGIQEEAPSLGKPVLVMRDTTERPEGIAAGTLKLVGTEEENIYNNFSNLLENKDEYVKMSKSSNPYGDGTACKQIVNIILQKL